MTRNVQNDAIIWTQATCHLERIDQFRSTPDLQGDGIVVRLPDLDRETETCVPMACQLNEAVRLQPAFEIEARLPGHDLHSNLSNSTFHRRCQSRACGL